MCRGTTYERVLSFVAFAIWVQLALPFAQAQTHLSFRSVTISGATHTEVNGIGGPSSSNETIVGFYTDAKNVEHGFKQAAGKTTVINFPGSTGTRAYGTDLNTLYIVGSYTDSKFVAHGFELQPSGQFVTIDVPGAVWTRALSVNSDSTIVGAYADKAGIVHGFLDKGGKGVFTTLGVPHAVVTEITGIVNLRYMSGIFVSSSGEEHGVEGAAGELGSPINVPGAGLTAANGVNDAVNIVGYYGTSAKGPFRGFLLDGGEFQTIDFPNATDTRCNGVSDSIDIVGRYTDHEGIVHGFFAKQVF